MATYDCGGSVSINGSGKQATCSVNWVVYTAPSCPPATTTTIANTLTLTGELITEAQFRDLVTGLLLLFTVIAVYRALSRISD